MKHARILLFAASLAGFGGIAVAQEVSRVYEVDQDRDGRTDYLMKLEQSDTLA